MVKVRDFSMKLRGRYRTGRELLLRRYREGTELHRSYYGFTPELHRSNIGITQVYVRYNSEGSNTENGGFH